MTAVVFNNGKYEIFEKSPLVADTQKRSTLCVIGSRYQRWFYMGTGGWVEFSGRHVSKKIHNQIKMICLTLSKQYPLFHT